MVDANLQRQPSGALYDGSSDAGGGGVGGGGGGVGGTDSVVSESEAAASEAVATRRGMDAVQVRTRSQDEKRPPSPSKVHAEKQWLQNAEAAAELEPKPDRTAVHDCVPVKAGAATISGIGVRAEEEVKAERPSRRSRAKESTKALIDPKYDADKLAHGVELPWAPTGVDRLVISPGNRLVWVFNCLIILCVLTTAIVTPMEVAYRVDHILGRGVDIAIDVLYLVDMALQCVHGYQEGGYPVLSLRRVALRYAHSWLLIDLVAVLPWEFIA